MLGVVRSRCAKSLQEVLPEASRSPPGGENRSDENVTVTDMFAALFVVVKRDTEPGQTWRKVVPMTKTVSHPVGPEDWSFIPHARQILPVGLLDKETEWSREEYQENVHSLRWVHSARHECTLVGVKRLAVGHCSIGELEILHRGSRNNLRPAEGLPCQGALASWRCIWTRHPA